MRHQLLALGIAYHPAVGEIVLAEELAVLINIPAHLAAVELEVLHALRHFFIVHMVEVLLSVFCTGGEACRVKLAVPATHPLGQIVVPRVALVQQVQTIRMERLIEFCHTVHVECLPRYSCFLPAFVHVLPEILVVIFNTIHIEFPEHLQTVFSVSLEIALPIFRVEYGIEHLGEVLHVLRVGADLRGDVPHLVTIPHLAFGCRVTLHVVLGQLSHADPVVIALAFDTEGRPHTDPVLRTLISVLAGVFATDDVAEAIVGRPVLRSVLAHLLECAIHDSLQMRHLLDFHFHGGPRRAVGTLRPLHRAHIGVVVGVGRGGGGETASHTQADDVGKACGSSLQVVRGHNARQRVVLRYLTDDRFEGLRLVSRIIHIGEVGQLTHHIVKLEGFRSLGSNFLLFLLLSLAPVFIIIA